MSDFPSKAALEGSALPQIPEEYARILSIPLRAGGRLEKAREKFAEARAKLRSDLAYDFETLIRDRCESLTLFLAMWLTRQVPFIASDWRSLAGDRIESERKVQTLHECASLLESLGQKAKEVDSIGIIELVQAFNSGTVVDPTHTAFMLRLYANLLSETGKVVRAYGVQRPDDIQRYLLSAYVKRKTGRFHDREVSSLLGGYCMSVEGEIYDETAHRMWRSRKFDRIEQGWNWIPRILVKVGCEIEAGDAKGSLEPIPSKARNDSPEKLSPNVTPNAKESSNVECPAVTP